MTDWTLEDAKRSNARIERGEAADEVAEADARKAWKAEHRPTQQRPQGAQVPAEGELTEQVVEDITYAQRPARYVRERYSDGCCMEYITTIMED